MKRHNDRVKLFVIFVAFLFFITLYQFSVGNFSLDTTSTLEMTDKIVKSETPADIIKLSLLNPPEERSDVNDMDFNILERELREYYSLINVKTSEENIKSELDILSELDASYQKILALSILAHNDAYILNEEALSKLTSAEREYALSKITISTEEDTKLDSIRTKVDTQKQLLGSFYLQDAAEKIREFRKFNAALPSASGLELGICDVNGDVLFASHDCSIIVGGIGNNIYYSRHKIVIEPSGNDTTYQMGTGNVDVALHIDLEGNDYHKGAGIGDWGIGIAIDLLGKDYYDCSGECQAFGDMGVGILTDYAGDDNYICTYGSCQASGFLGFAYLFELSGNDHYSCFSYCQSWYGIFVDVQGRDKYYCYEFCLGNLRGAHIDIEGNDYYSCSFHCLTTINIAGDDIYYCEAYCFGSLLASGIFLDITGQNQFYCSNAGNPTFCGMLGQGKSPSVPDSFAILSQIPGVPSVPSVPSVPTIPSVPPVGNPNLPVVTVYHDNFGQSSVSNPIPTINTLGTVQYRSGGSAAWYTISDGTDINGVSARSGNIGSTQTSHFEMEFTITDNSIYFYQFRYKTRGKDENVLTGTGDKFRFSVQEYLLHPISGQKVVINTAECLKDSGIKDWQVYGTTHSTRSQNPMCTTLGPGNYIFKWVYERDGGQPVSDSGAWLDFIQIDRRPLAL